MLLLLFAGEVISRVVFVVDVVCGDDELEVFVIAAGGGFERGGVPPTPPPPPAAKFCLDAVFPVRGGSAAEVVAIET